MKKYKCQIKELGKVITGATPPTKKREYYGDKIPLIKPTDMNIDSRYIGETEESLSEEGVKLFKNKLIPPNTPCVVTIGTIGKLCLTREISLCNQAVNSIIVNQNKHNSMFIFYLMKLTIPRVKFLSSGTASGRENVSKSAFSAMEVELPPLRIQKAIASILSNYDDLIENNNRRIKILEEMAKTLYQEWFVKFRFPNHENVKMVDSDLGLIPQGWQVKKLGDLASFKTGKLNSNAAKPDGIYPFFTCSQQTFKTDTYSFDTDCVLLAGNNANGIFHIKYFNGKFDVYQRTYVIQTLDKQTVSNYYLYFGIKQQLELLKSISTGVATKFLTIKILNNINIVVSSNQIQEQFSDFLSKVFFQIDILQKKNENLRKTRDLLLPKLISGEIDVENLNINTERLAA